MFNYIPLIVYMYIAFILLLFKNKSNYLIKVESNVSQLNNTIY